MKIDGKSVAFVGDKVECDCTNGPHHIITGTNVVERVEKNGEKNSIARIGDKTSCGAIIKSGSNEIGIDGTGVAVDGSLTSCGGIVRVVEK
ncbi:PAAR domain-containing protein [Halomonas binhaiensis]|uniref:PAAR domain-containing protein n=2 Tax=Halomonas binhaiensis TaxID=2562282 RepID=A0A5C1NCK7_9GAMM|nr:PAAR domain-containing protein [Halomonas binhaiensis]QEM80198.1 PAAR domain-containing protein [Halomonas binhaiensis]